MFGAGLSFLKSDQTENRNWYQASRQTISVRRDNSGGTPCLTGKRWKRTASPGGLNVSDRCSGFLMLHGLTISGSSKLIGNLPLKKKIQSMENGKKDQWKNIISPIRQSCTDLRYLR